MSYKEKFLKQKSRNSWFIFNFIMEDEKIGVRKVEVPIFKSRAEKFRWFTNQLNIE